jgi:hypothetical protein
MIAAVTTGHASADEILEIANDPEAKSALTNVAGISLPGTKEGTIKALANFNADNLIIYAKKDAQNEVYQNVANDPGISDDESAAYKKIVLPNVGTVYSYKSAAEKTLRAFNIIYTAGKAGNITFDQAYKMSGATGNVLNMTDSLKAYREGRQFIWQNAAQGSHNATEQNNESERISTRETNKKRSTVKTEGKKTEQKQNGQNARLKYADDVSEEDKKQISKSFIDFVDRISKRFNAEVVFHKNLTNDKGEAVNGYHSGGTIHLAINQADEIHVIEGTMMHELTHHIQTLAPTEYEKMRSYVKSHWRDTNPDSFNHALGWKMDQYKRNGQDLTTDKAMDELMADWAVSILDDEKSVKALLAYDKTLFGKIMDALKKVLHDICVYLKEAVGAQDPKYLAASGLEDEFKRIWTSVANSAADAAYTVDNTKGSKRFSMADKETFDIPVHEYDAKRVFKNKDHGYMNEIKRLEDTQRKQLSDIISRKDFAALKLDVSSNTQTYIMFPSPRDDEDGKYEISSVTFDNPKYPKGYAWGHEIVTKNNAADVLRKYIGHAKGSTATVEAYFYNDKTGNKKFSVADAGYHAGDISAMDSEGMRFSMSEPVEESGNLIALHNIKEAELKASSELGGLAMPSIAITKVTTPHTGFGDVTLIGDKNVIDPKASRYNTVYDRDAWTPTFPSAEYNIDYDKASDANDKVKELLKGTGLHVSLDQSNVADNMNRYGDVEKAYGKDKALKTAYLIDTQNYTVPTKQKDYGYGSNDNLDKAIKWMQDNGVEIDKYADYDEKIKIKPIAAQIYSEQIKDNKFYQRSLSKGKKPENMITDNYVTGLYNAIADYYEKGASQETDTAKLDSDIESKVNQNDYLNWLHDLLDGTIIGKGIRKNTDIFTAAGNRKSFKAMHYDFTLENVVKAMRSESETGSDTIFPSLPLLRGAAAQKYSSISAIKKDAGRLSNTEEDIKDQIKPLSDEYLSIIEAMVLGKGTENSFTLRDGAGFAIIESAQNSKGNIPKFNRYLKGEFSDYYNINDDIINRLDTLLTKLKDLPISYFEAKPRRAVLLNEFKAAVIPDNATQDTRDILNSNGISVYKYKADDDADRLAKVNKAANDNDILFSAADTESKLQSKIARLRQETKLSHNKLIDEKSLNSFVKDIINIYNYQGDPADIKEGFRNIYSTLVNGNESRNPESLSNEAYNNLYEDIQKLARHIVENGGTLMDMAYPATKTSYTEGVRAAMDLIRANASSGSPMYVDPKHYRELTGESSYNNARKYLWGKHIYITDKYTGGVPIDTVIAEIASEHPEVVSSYDLNSDPYEIAGSIISQYDDLKNDKYPNLVWNNSDDEEELIFDCMNQLLDEATDIKTRLTFADKSKQLQAKKLKQNNEKWKRKVARTKAKYIEKTDRIKQRYDARLEAEKARAADRLETQKSKASDRLQQEKDKLKVVRAQDAQKLRDTKKDIRSKMRDTRDRKAMVESIRSNVTFLTQALLKPTDTVHIPMGIEDGVARVLYGVDFGTHRMDSYAEKHGISKTAATYRMLANQYKLLAQENENEKEGPATDIIYDLGLAEIIQALADKFDTLDGQTMGRVRLENMSTTDLMQVRQLMSALKHAVSKVNTTYAGNQKQTISELSDSVIRELTPLKDFTKGRIGTGFDQYFNVANAKPVDFFDRLGSKTLIDSFSQLRDAHDKFILNMKTSQDFIREVKKKHGLTTKDMKTWHGNTAELHKFKLNNGQNISVTTGQLMELYALMQREQAKTHILGSGMEIAAVPHKGSWKRSTPRIKTTLTYGDIAMMTGKLTQAQRDFADEILQFIRTTGTEWGNETSRQMFGYEKFGERNYYPIHTSQDYVAQTSNPAANTPKLINGGATKATVINASNPIVLGDFFDTATSHLDFMAQYNALVPALTDFERIINYNSRDMESGRIESSVKATIKRKFGEDYNKYIRQLLSDINTSREKDNDLKGVDMMLRLMKIGSIATNLRVLVQQPTSIIRANYYIDGKYLTASAAQMKGFNKATTKRMWEISPLAYWKHQGFQETDISRPMQDIMFNEDHWWDAATFGMYGAADDITWRVIFGAVEMETKAKMAKGELTFKYDDADYRKYVNDRFRFICDRTQVVDSVFHRSQIMRSTNALVKSVTSFMSEPTTNWNMLLTTFSQAAKYKREGQNGKAAKTAAKGISVLVAESIAVSFASALIDTIRQTYGGSADDDRKKKKFLEQLIGNWTKLFRDPANFLKNPANFYNSIKDSYFWQDLKGNINPLEWIPIVNDVYDTVMYYASGKKEGYEYSAPYLQMFKSLGQTIDSAHKIATGDTGYYSTLGYVQLLVQQASAVAGIPVKNIMKDVTGVIRAAYWAKGDKATFDFYYNKLFSNAAKNSTQYIQQYLKDKETDPVLGKQELQWLKDSGVKDKQIQSAVKKNYKSELDKAIANHDTKTIKDIIAEETKNGISKEKVMGTVKTAFNKQMKTALASFDVDTIKTVVKSMKDVGLDTSRVKSSMKTGVTDAYKATFEHHDPKTRKKIDSLLSDLGYTKLEVASHRVSYEKGYARYKVWREYAKNGYDSAYKMAVKYCSKYPNIYSSASAMMYGIKNLSSYSKDNYRQGKWQSESPSGKYSYYNVNNSKGSSKSSSSSGGSRRTSSRSYSSSRRSYSSSSRSSSRSSGSSYSGSSSSGSSSGSSASYSGGSSGSSSTYYGYRSNPSYTYSSSNGYVSASAGRTRYASGYTEYRIYNYLQAGDHTSAVKAARAYFKKYGYKHYKSVADMLAAVRHADKDTKKAYEKGKIKKQK